MHAIWRDLKNGGPEVLFVGRIQMNMVQSKDLRADPIRAYIYYNVIDGSLSKNTSMNDVVNTISHIQRHAAHKRLFHLTVLSLVILFIGAGFCGTHTLQFPHNYLSLHLYR
jgi:hypothetical protein